MSAKAKLHPYPGYRDSGVEWLGKVPEHWEVKPLKFAARLKTERATSSDNQIALENIESWSGRFIDTGTVYEGEGVAFEKDYILFGKLRPYLAKVLLANQAGAAVGDFHVVQPAVSMDSKFCSYQMREESFIFIINSSTFGAKMPRVSWEFMGNMRFLVPPTSEQVQIAAFLDHETGKIDSLIAEQEGLVGLLQEKRQAVISHAVTKGLDPNAPMKDSGVEWLGEVPEHWVVKPLKYISKLNPQKSEYRGSKEIECSFVPMDSLKRGVVLVDDPRKIGEVFNSYTYFCEGDVLSAKVTPCFENQNTAIAEGLINGIGFGSSEINVFRPTGVNTVFLFYRLLENSLMNYWTSEMKGAGGLKRVPTEVSENHRIAVPPAAEQTEIAAFLDTETLKLDALVAEARRCISLLRERRGALISAAVTGKIDVRGWRAGN